MSHPHHLLPSADAVAGLVSAAQYGSTSAVNALLTTLRPALVSFFRRRVAHDVAEDLAQAALVRITRALPSIEPNRADRFIVTVACNLVRTARAQQGRDRQRLAPAQLAEQIRTPPAADRDLEYQELARAVHRVIAAKLPPALQEPVLGMLRGETPTEVALRLQVSPATVRTRLMRARSILRRELQSHRDLAMQNPQDRAG